MEKTSSKFVKAGVPVTLYAMMFANDIALTEESEQEVNIVFQMAYKKRTNE